jgi:hypothetical protein
MKAVEALGAGAGEGCELCGGGGEALGEVGRGDVAVVDLVEGAVGG